MSNYNLDDNKGFLNLFNKNNPQNILLTGNRIDIKHYNMFDFSNAFILGVSAHLLKIKFRTSLPELDFFPEDPVVLNYIHENQLYSISSEIHSIETLDPLILNINIINIVKKKSLRKNERFYISITAQLNQPDISNSYFAIVKNLSSSGIKLNCKEDISLNKSVNITMYIDNYYSINFKGLIVRKNKLKSYYEYGVEIKDITKTNKLTFQHYINQLKSDTLK